MSVLEAPRPSECDNCGAPVILATTAGGSAMPLDPEPFTGGNVRLVDGSRAEIVGALEAMDEQLYGSHLARCPRSEWWSRR